ncbi:NADAR family protein [Bdellovibrio sp.]|uniref:NADAR family protein n=1 Tax=Bdellovibrio TaxID=958 RepID=UPI003221796D
MKAFWISLLLLPTVLVMGCTKPNSAVVPQTPITPANQTDDSWKNDFPAHWWKEVPREEAKSWEILPQDAGYKEVVLSKRNELGLLSNFTETPFVFHGVCYPTVEAFWQMMKYPETENDPRWKWAKNWKYTREQVSQMNGYAAKSAGGYANFLMEKNEANWVTFEGKVIPFATKEPQEHYQLIFEALTEKLRQNPRVLEVVLATKDLKLLPDHGVSERSPREWHYYLLWMDIREMVKQGQLSLETSEDLSLKTCKARNY